MTHNKPNDVMKLLYHSKLTYIAKLFSYLNSITIEIMH